MGKAYEARNDIVNTLFCYGKAQTLLPRNGKKMKIMQQYTKKYSEFYEKSTLIAERITAGQSGKMPVVDKKQAEIITKKVDDAFRLIEKHDPIYAQFLRVMYVRYVFSMSGR